jgi:ParB family transcriptional regulator, chromosome partitioning protein
MSNSRKVASVGVAKIDDQRRTPHPLRKSVAVGIQSNLDNLPAVGQASGMAKPVLGRGLNALLGGSGAAATAPLSPDPVAASGESVQMMALDRVRPCPFQPRKDFSDEAIQELAESIKAQGIVQPLIVRIQGDIFELIAGERRWRAARAAGLLEVPIIVREADDRKVLELALIENLQRENLNAIEEALGYSDLIRQFDLTQDAVAVKVGKSRASVANALRLLRLAPEIQSHLRNNRLSVGHAKVILGLADGEQQMLAADKVLRGNLNVRQTEKLISQLGNPGGGAAGSASIATNIDPHISDLENKLRERLGTKVSLKYRQGKGSVEIKFFDDEDLERVIQLLGISTD